MCLTIMAVAVCGGMDQSFAELSVTLSVHHGYPGQVGLNGPLAFFVLRRSGTGLTKAANGKGVFDCATHRMIDDTRLIRYCMSMPLALAVADAWPLEAILLTYCRTCSRCGFGQDKTLLSQRRRRWFYKGLHSSTHKTTASPARSEPIGILENEIGAGFGPARIPYSIPRKNTHQEVLRRI
ncbi:hypothetical protein BD309DRAFT_747864 [Dichomitus squalens]|uniref:Uncharacterized protein n=1 Tax=Dichomitus squalens TaxID=114155 RepID=A0A4Q9NXS7_9APHY|nr:hypothetical protein BD309DRAFT_747864 [Dichomitus squalens]TBU63919.1 hypothetical protein BD310DRAFT_458331 [Dichomitus squalens]